MKTVDRGDTWTPQASNTDQWLKDIHFVDSLTGWVVGASTILNTKDGGMTWNQQG